MILNAWAVIIAFLIVVKVSLSILTIAAGLRVARTQGYRSTQDAIRFEAAENQYPLLFLAAAVLLVLALASWPLFYVLLDSYVPEWPDVMCIYGVTQVGTGSVGPSRFLPGLVRAIECTKPAAVLVIGVLLVLHWINRQTKTAPLSGRVLVAILAVGFIGIADAAFESAYLLIPKREDYISTGCCTVALQGRSLTARYLPDSILDSNRQLAIGVAHYGLTALLVLGLIAAIVLSRRAGGSPIVCRWLAPLLFVGAGLSLVTGGIFLTDTVAPVLLGLPFHHCVYDLVSTVLESGVAIAIFVLGSFSVAWGCIACWLGRVAETDAILRELLPRLFRVAIFGYTTSMGMISVSLILAQWD
jgi:hypothetical protein